MKAKVSNLPAIPDKKYFTIGEASELCDLRSHVLRYWEQEFPQLEPVKRRGNRRYYQRHDIELVRTIRSLLYEQGFTIQGARQFLSKKKSAKKSTLVQTPVEPELEVALAVEKAVHGKAEHQPDLQLPTANSAPAEPFSDLSLPVDPQLRQQLIDELDSVIQLLKK